MPTETKYNYSVSTDFSNGVDINKLKNEIEGSSIVTGLLRIDKLDDDCDVWFKDGLSSGEQTTLNSLIAAHDGIPLDAPTKTIKLDAPYYGGKPSIRAESRPDGTASYFTTAGDSATEIGEGTRFEWDFSNTDNDVTAPAGYKKKQIDITFVDEVWVKEGTIYFYNAIKGSYVNLLIVCPDQGYYYDQNGDLQQASGDVSLDRYVNKHPIQESVPMGDELNTEAATISSIPAGYIFRLEIIVPDTDSTSNGYAELELYRKRSVLLPGESI